MVYLGSNRKKIKNIKAQRKLWYSYKKCVFLQKKCVISKQKAHVSQILEGFNLTIRINKKDTSKIMINNFHNEHLLHIYSSHFQTVAFCGFSIKAWRYDLKWVTNQLYLKKCSWFANYIKSFRGN